MRVIRSRAELVELASELDLASWHEPDQVGVTARWTVRPGGESLDLDNAMGAGNCYGAWTGKPRAEMFAVLCHLVVEGGVARYGRDIAAVQLATLFEWASTPGAEPRYKPSRPAPVLRTARLRPNYGPAIIGDYAFSIISAETPSHKGFHSVHALITRLQSGADHINVRWQFETFSGELSHRAIDLTGIVIGDPQNADQPVLLRSSAIDWQAEHITRRGKVKQGVDYHLTVQAAYRPSE